jgi:hypothetical protein
MQIPPESRIFFFQPKLCGLRRRLRFRVVIRPKL